MVERLTCEYKILQCYIAKISIPKSETIAHIENAHQIGHRVLIHGVFEMINQDFQVQGGKYQALPFFRIHCRELGLIKVPNCHTCACSFCSCQSNHSGCSISPLGSK